MVYPKLPDHRDLEDDRVAGLDPYGVVFGHDVELARQDRLRELGQVESGGLPTCPPSESQGDRDHVGTIDQECFWNVTRPQSFGDGAEVGGYPRNVNVISATAPTAVPSVRAAARGAVVPLTPAG